MKRPPAADVGLAAGLAAALAVEQALAGTGPTRLAGGAALTTALTVPLAWRRAAPLASTVGTWAALMGWVLAYGDDDVPGTVLLAVPLAAYSVGAHAARQRALAGALAGLALAFAIPLASGRSVGEDAPFIAIILFGVPWSGGRLIRRHRVGAERLAALAEELRREREEHERLAVLAERARIAAELNDAVAHALSAILVQAGAASEVIAADPGAAKAALREVQERGREAILELRRMLALMRAPDSGGPQADS